MSVIWSYHLDSGGNSPTIPMILAITCSRISGWQNSYAVANTDPICGQHAGKKSHEQCQIDTVVWLSSVNWKEFTTLCELRNCKEKLTPRSFLASHLCYNIIAISRSDITKVPSLVVLSPSLSFQHTHHLTLKNGDFSETSFRAWSEQHWMAASKHPYFSQSNYPTHFKQKQRISNIIFTCTHHIS